MKKYLVALSFCFLNFSCHVGRYVIYNFANITDYKKFPANPITKPAIPFSFLSFDSSYKANPVPLNINTKGLIMDIKKINQDEIVPFDKFLEDNNTVAFLVIRNDSIFYEKYFQHYSKESIVTVFSVTKSFVSALTGIAIDEGYIKSVNQPITDYLPQLKNKSGFEKITIEHLLNMRSGIKFNESYSNPFGDAAKYYYGLNIKKYISHLKIKKEPDQEFEYISINTQLLALIVENATGKSLSEYLQEKIWQPLGMEYDATWSIDGKKSKTEKAFCGINARARDIAKFGRLYLNNGNWNDKQIISESWINKSTNKNKESKWPEYSYQWWHSTKIKIVNDSTKIENGDYVESHVNKNGKYWHIRNPLDDYDFWAEGILGQFIFVYPSKNMIIVRLSKNDDNVNWPKLFRMIGDGRIMKLK